MSHFVVVDKYAETTKQQRNCFENIISFLWQCGCVWSFLNFPRNISAGTFTAERYWFLSLSVIYWNSFLQKHFFIPALFLQIKFLFYLILWDIYLINFFSQRNISAEIWIIKREFIVFSDILKQHFFIPTLFLWMQFYFVSPFHSMGYFCQNHCIYFCRYLYSRNISPHCISSTLFLFWI